MHFNTVYYLEAREVYADSLWQQQQQERRKLTKSESVQRVYKGYYFLGASYFNRFRGIF